MWETLAGCLRVQSLPSRASDESVLDYLAAKRLLLVLDNCEHLLDAVARVVDTIEHRCPDVSVLATSREALGLAGERLVAVPPLSVPAADADGDELWQAEAVCLFGDRASAAKRDFALTDRNVGAVGVLCRRLDGIPLAIELAAARVRSLSPEDLVSRLDQRFTLLTHGSRAAPERHQTLRSTIDWSYDLLTPTERHALQRLSVFAGGCDLAAAEAVLPDDEFDAADVIDVLGQLVDKSLVVVDDTDSGVRYRLLETIRQYARERLDASDDPGAVRRRHADHYVALAEAAGPHLRGREHLEWTSVVERDIDNFRAALDWAVETPSPEHGLRLVASLAVGGRTEELAMGWAATAIAIPGGDGHPLFPAVAGRAAWGAVMVFDFERAEDLVGVAERAEAALGIRLTSVARAQAILAFFRNDFEEARRYAEERVELAQKSGDAYDLAEALIMLAGALQFTEPTFDAAIATIDECVRVARAAGLDGSLAMALPMAAPLLPIEESERALALLDEAIEIGTRIGDRMAVSSATGTKAQLAARRGDWRTALEGAVDAAEQARELGESSIHGCLYTAGVALCALGSCEPAAVLFGKADATRNDGMWIGCSNCSPRPTPPSSKPSANNRSRRSPNGAPPSTSPTPSPTYTPKPTVPSPRHNARSERSPAQRCRHGTSVASREGRHARTRSGKSVEYQGHEMSRDHRGTRFVAVATVVALLGVVGASAASAAPPAGVSMTGTGKPPAGVGLFSSAALAQKGCAENGRTTFTSEGSGPWCVNPWPAGKNNGGATAQGVTATKVNVVAYLPNTQMLGPANVGSPQNQATKEPAPLKDVMEDWQAAYKYAAEKVGAFQLWGRTSGHRPRDGERPGRDCPAS